MIFYYNSTQLGAPELSGTPGALKTLLQTCLVNGFGAGSATGITVADGVATVGFSGTHPYIVDGPIAVAGATPAELNGNKTVTAITTNSVEFAAPGVPDGAATGAITTKVPGAGWQEMFAGTANLLVLKPTAVEATGMLLRVDDTGTNNARVRGFEAMTSISNGLGPIPLDAQANGGLWWPKSATASSAARAWFIVSDARGMYVGFDPNNQGRYHLMYAGDFASEKSGDAYSFIITGNLSDLTTSANTPEGCVGYSGRTTRGGAFISRLHTGVGGAVQAQRIGQAHNGAGADLYSGTAGYSPAGSGPNSPNNGIPVCPLELIVQGQRGTLPGLYHLRNDWGSLLAHGTVIDGTDDLFGKKLLVARVGPSSGPNAGTVLLDITGPWDR